MSWLTSWYRARQMVGFAHLELLPVNEHRSTEAGAISPPGYTHRLAAGTRDDFRYFVDAAHAAGLNVILDWVRATSRRMFLRWPVRRHKTVRAQRPARKYRTEDWNTLIYSYTVVVKSRTTWSNALYWIERFGIDALRVDVASMICRDYSQRGQVDPERVWRSRELEAIGFCATTSRIIGEQVEGA